MNTMQKKIKLIENVLLVVTFIVLVIGLFMPKTGPNVLMDEFFEILLWWCIGGYVVCKIVEAGKKGTASQIRGRIIVVIVGILLCVWVSRNVVVDITSGTETIILHNASVSRYQGFAGALTVHYHITGEDEEGNTCRFEISQSDYSKYVNGGTVKVKYYPKTERVVELQ